MPHAIGKRGLHLLCGPLEQRVSRHLGGRIKQAKITVISDQDVLGDRLIRPPQTQRRAENFCPKSRSLSPAIWWVQL